MVAGLVIACSPSSNTNPPLVEIFANGKAVPQCSYSGPGFFSYSSGIDTFGLKVGNQIQLSGDMIIGESNEVRIIVKTDSTIPFSLVFKGMATTNDPAITQAQPFISSRLNLEGISSRIICFFTTRLNDNQPPVSQVIPLRTYARSLNWISFSKPNGLPPQSPGLRPSASKKLALRSFVERVRSQIVWLFSSCS